MSNLASCRLHPRERTVRLGQQSVSDWQIRPISNNLQGGETRGYQSHSPPLRLACQHNHTMCSEDLSTMSCECPSGCLSSSSLRRVDTLPSTLSRNLQQITNQKITVETVHCILIREVSLFQKCLEYTGILWVWNGGVSLQLLCSPQINLLCPTPTPKLNQTETVWCPE